jgi:hypothetical protein
VNCGYIDEPKKDVKDVAKTNKLSSVKEDAEDSEEDERDQRKVQSLFKSALSQNEHLAPVPPTQNQESLMHSVHSLKNYSSKVLISVNNLFFSCCCYPYCNICFFPSETGDGNQTIRIFKSD